MTTRIPISFYLAEVAQGLWNHWEELKTYPIVQGPNSGLFVDSQKDFPNCRPNFTMTIEPADCSSSSIILQEMRVESCARVWHKNETWFVFVAKHDGAVFNPADHRGQASRNSWGEFFNTQLVAGEFCPDTRKGRVCDLNELLDCLKVMSLNANQVNK